MTPCYKGSASKWVLPSNPNGWQELDGSHQRKVAETLLCLKKKKKKKGYVVVPSFCFAKSFYVSFTFLFFFPSSDYVTGQKL